VALLVESGNSSGSGTTVSGSGSVFYVVFPV